MDIPMSLLCAAIGYLLGSVSGGILISRHLGRDIRLLGSKSAGSSNMLRVYGKKAAALTFACDCLKAALAVLAGTLLYGHTGGMIAGLLAVVGHCWPVFFGFRGGKGIACCTAVIVLLHPVAGIAAILLCLCVIALTKYISLGSLVMVAAYAAIVAATSGLWPGGVWALALFLLCAWRHRGNIQRLLRGNERKLGEKETQEL